MNLAFGLAVLTGLCVVQDKKPSEQEKILKGKTSLLGASRKDFGAFLGADASKGVVTVRLERDGKEQSLRLEPDAEIRIRGSWGRVEDLPKGDRVWIWRTLDREKKPAGIIMIADEIAEQAIHRTPYTVKTVDARGREVVIHRAMGRKKKRQEETRTLKAPESLDLGGLKKGDSVYVQTAGKELRLLLNEEGLEKARREQRERLRERWRRQGLPGTVGYVHSISGEAEIILDHATMRWARALNVGDVVQVNLDKPIRAVVHEMRPYRERTRLTLVAAGQEFSVLAPGRRVRIGVKEPSEEIRVSKFPPDMGRREGKKARTEWFLSSTYCGCSLPGDT